MSTAHGGQNKLQPPASAVSDGIALFNWSFEASPTRGVLAPRGGSSNLCDETSPYPDAADITIKWNGEGGGIGAVPERGPSLLVVGRWVAPPRAGDGKAIRERGDGDACRRDGSRERLDFDGLEAAVVLYDAPLTGRLDVLI